MSSLTKNLFCLQSIKSVLNLSSVGLFSTQTNITVQNEHDEPDKLYKAIQIEARGYEPATLKSYKIFTTMAADCLGITVGKCYAPKKPFHMREGLTLLRSQFVHKKHRVQYEVRTYFSFMTFHYMTGSTADTFLEYIERNLPEGISLKITKVAIEKLPDQIVSPPENETEENVTDNANENNEINVSSSSN